MTTAAQDIVPEADWNAVLSGDREAFKATVQPYLDELLEAARREVRYRVALGDFRDKNPTAKELVGDVLIRAWQDRRRRPRELSVKAWLIAELFRTAADVARKQARLNKETISLEEEAPPPPIYDDDEEFYEWYQPDESTRWEDVIDAGVKSPEQATEAVEVFTRSLDARAREVVLMHELHGLQVPEIAIALGLSEKETAELLRTARQRLRAWDQGG
jgi:RNA polymerase sigma-70 factor (ECF subfamily)